MWDLVWILGPEQGRRRARREPGQSCWDQSPPREDTSALRAQFPAQLITPFLSAAPSLVLLPRYMMGFRRNGWSRVVKKRSDSMVKAEQRLQWARFSRGLTVRQVRRLFRVRVPGWFRARAGIYTWAACLPGLWSHPPHTASRQEAVSEPPLSGQL